jgi:Fe2+ transport system protein A
MKLSELAVGDTAVVTGYASNEPGYRKRLLAMGLTPGTVLTVSRLAPLGDPVEISVRGFALSLRRHEADVVEIKRQS